MDKGRYTLWLPVWMHDKVSTCLEITQSRPFSAHKLDVLMGVFQVYQNYQSLLDYSERDALTGLFNRKTFDEQFSRTSLNGMVSGRLASAPEPLTADDASQPGEPLQQWLAVVDIDHFKQVNDRFGHLYGDEVLILVANILRSSFRSHDRIFRFGGEEFVVLLPGADAPAALEVAQHIQQAIQALALPHEGAPHGIVTVSFGVATMAPQREQLAEELVRRADLAMYRAKQGGRNRIEQAPEP